MHLEEERDGAYFADVDDEEEEDNDDDDGSGRVFFIEDGDGDGDRDLAGTDDDADLPGMPDDASDTASIIDELLCCGEVDVLRAFAANEVLGGAELPLTPDLEALEGGSRRVSMVNGLEEELPVPVIMVVKELFGSMWWLL